MRNSKTLRRGALALSTLALTFGLSTAPALVETASANTNVWLCNSPESGTNPMVVYYTDDSYSDVTVWRRECRLFVNTSALRVQIFTSAWKVRRVPGTYGSCQHATTSNPGQEDKYSYVFGSTCNGLPS